MMKFLTSTISLLLVAAAAIAQTAPKGLVPGTQAPDFMAKDQYAKRVALHAEIQKGPVVLLFYRGQWCPYCNRQLSQLQDSLKQITDRGAMVIAVTPEAPENVNMTISKTKASFSILHDEGLNIMKKYDVAYTVNTTMATNLKKNGIDLVKANGANGNHLPVPAVYIIDKSGKIIYRHFDEDYTQRASVRDILDHLQMYGNQ